MPYSSGWTLTAPGNVRRSDVLDHPAESGQVDATILGYMPSERPRRMAWPLAAASIIGLSLALWIVVIAGVSALRHI